MHLKLFGILYYQLSTNSLLLPTIRNCWDTVLGKMIDCSFNVFFHHNPLIISETIVHSIELKSQYCQSCWLTTQKKTICMTLKVNWLQITDTHSTSYQIIVASTWYRTLMKQFVTGNYHQLCLLLAFIFVSIISIHTIYDFDVLLAILSEVVYRWYIKRNAYYKWKHVYNRNIRPIDFSGGIFCVKRFAKCGGGVAF